MQYVRHDDEAIVQVGKVPSCPHPCLDMIFVSLEKWPKEIFALI